MVFSKVLFARKRSSMNYESFEEYDCGQLMTKTIFGNQTLHLIGDISTKLQEFTYIRNSELNTPSDTRVCGFGRLFS